jgi:hypothetical protein
MKSYDKFFDCIFLLNLNNDYYLYINHNIQKPNWDDFSKNIAFSEITQEMISVNLSGIIYSDNSEHFNFEEIGAQVLNLIKFTFFKDIPILLLTTNKIKECVLDFNSQKIIEIPKAILGNLDLPTNKIETWMGRISLERSVKISRFALEESKRDKEALEFARDLLSDVSNNKIKISEEETPKPSLLSLDSSILQKIYLKVFTNPILFAIISSYLLVLLIRAFIDSSVLGWDSALYGTESYNLASSIKSFNLPEIARTLLSTIGTKPPLISWIGSIFVLLFSSIGSTFALHLMIIFFSISNILILNKILYNRFQENLMFRNLGLLIFGSSTLYIGLSQVILVEVIQIFVVLLAIRCMESKINFGLISTLSIFLILFCLSLLVKIPTLLVTFVFLFMFLVVQYKIGKVKTEKKKLKYLVLVSLAIFILTLTFSWYFENFKEVVDFSFNLSTGSASLIYGESLNLQDSLWYWIKSFVDILTYLDYLNKLLFTLFVTAVIYNLYNFVSRFVTSYPNLLNFRNFDLVHFFTICLYISFLSIQNNSEIRFLLPILPSFALFVSNFIYNYCRLKLISRYTILITKLLSFLLFIAMELSLLYSLNLTNIGRGNSNWLYPANQSNIDLINIKDTVIQTCPSFLSPDTSLFVVDTPSFNLNSANYYSSILKFVGYPSCQYNYLGIQNLSGQEVITRIEQGSERYIISSLDHYSGDISITENSLEVVNSWLLKNFYLVSESPVSTLIFERPK